jgi:hypothetical protein
MINMADDSVQAETDQFGADQRENAGDQAQKGEFTSLLKMNIV